jgi:hypothetical protein
MRPAMFLLILIVAFFLVVEIFSRQGFDRLSDLQRQTIQEYRLALAMGRNPTNSKRQVLVVGNSLLKEGLRFNDLERALSPDWEARRFVVVQTTYFDWYYGLRRLLQDGARPDSIVLVLSANQLMASTVLGDYFGHYLMTIRDLPSVVRDLRLDLTTAASLLFANVSGFYGVRSEIRKRLLVRLMPDLPQLTTLLTRGKTPQYSDEKVYTRATERLQACKSLAAEYNCRFILVVPPVLRAQDHYAALQDAGTQVGVPVIVAAGSGTLGPGDFSDGSHLNQQGAVKYTRSLVPLLCAEIFQSPQQSAQTSVHLDH